VQAASAAGHKRRQQCSCSAQGPVAASLSRASKGDVESRRLERASHLLTAPLIPDSARPAGDNHRSGGRRDCTDVQLENLAYPWSFVAARSKRIAARIENPVKNPAASR